MICELSRWLRRKKSAPLFAWLSERNTKVCRTWRLPREHADLDVNETFLQHAIHSSPLVPGHSSAYFLLSWASGHSERKTIQLLRQLKRTHSCKSILLNTFFAIVPRSSMLIFNSLKMKSEDYSERSTGCSCHWWQRLTTFSTWTRPYVFSTFISPWSSSCFTV